MGVSFSDLSTRDYFHPSVSGQAKIAAATWEKAIEKGVFSAPLVALPPASPTAPTCTTVDDTSSKISWSGGWAKTATRPTTGAR